MSGEEDHSKPEGRTARANPSLFHFDALQRRLGDDREAAEAVLSTFSQDAPKQLARLRRAAEDGATEQVRLLAHSMKGSLLWIGADGAAASAHVLEQAVAAGSAIPGAAVSRFSAEVELLLAALRSRAVPNPG
jgi:HPt (histidine-containing phosphotransfer) domain-containing protein